MSFCVVHPLSDGERGRGFGSMMGKTLQGSLATSWELCLAILHRRVDARCGARSPFLCLSLCFLLPRLGAIFRWSLAQGKGGLCLVHLSFREG